MKAVSSIDSICNGLAASAEAVKLYSHGIEKCEDGAVKTTLANCLFGELQSIQDLAIALTDCFVEKKTDDKANDN